MTKRLISLLLIIFIIMGVTPGVFASEEPPLSEREVSEGESTAAELLTEEPAPETEAETRETEPVESAAEEAAETEVYVTVETSSEDGEEALPLVYTLPSGEEIEVDPEDPVYAERMNGTRTLMSAWNGIETYQSFQPREVDGEIVRPGIDVSSWQGTIDWEKVADAGVEFVFLRGAYRGTSLGALAKDLRFEQYIKGAKAAGLKVGVYVYSQAITPEEGREEAEFLIELVKDYEIDLPLVIDYEYYGYGGRLYNAKLTDRERTDICLAFCEAVEAAGYDAMVYANASMLKDDMVAQELDRVWLAHFTKKTNYSGEYQFWQCSDSGSISGISGNVDLDFWFDVEPENESDPFRDVTGEHWFYDTVMEAYEKGIVSGLGDGVFGPYDNAQRGQVVTMLHRLMGEPAATVDAGFTDLTADYYIAAVNWAAENEIVRGYSETEFGPSGLITRQDLVTLLYRMESSPSVNGDLSAYSDEKSVRDYARNAMIWATEKGIINGYEDGTLRPAAEATRAEVCAILMRYVDLAA